MKLPIATLSLAVTAAWAGPVASTSSVDTVLADLQARTDAAFYHAGPDLVLRAVSSSFDIVGTASLTKRQAAEWHTSLNQPMVARAPFDKAEMLGALTVHARSDAPEDVFGLEERQGCFAPCGGGGPTCGGGCSCRCSSLVCFCR